MVNEQDSDFMQYLAHSGLKPGEPLPSIQILAKTLGISVGKLREQLEVARTLGYIDIRPKSGMQRRKYSFYPAMNVSLRYALSTDPGYFNQIEQLREHLEACFWYEAVEQLEELDKDHLRSLLEKAWTLLNGSPITIPHDEHRDLHLTIFSRLDNVFVHGILEAYWDGYDSVGLNRYTDYVYFKTVWTYHEQMVDSILNNEYDSGYRALIEHFDILHRRPSQEAMEANNVIESSISNAQHK